MRSREPRRILVQAAKLREGQRRELMRALSQADEVVQTLQSRAVNCSHCHSERMVRNGHGIGLRRYKCRTCARLRSGSLVRSFEKQTLDRHWMGASHSALGLITAAR